MKRLAKIGQKQLASGKFRSKLNPRVKKWIKDNLKDPILLAYVHDELIRRHKVDSRTAYSWIRKALDTVATE